MQLIVYKGDKLVQRLFVPSPPGLKKYCNFRSIGFRHAIPCGWNEKWMRPFLDFQGALNKFRTVHVFPMKFRIT